MVIPNRIHFPSIDSTNLYLKNAIEQEPTRSWHGTVVTADYQTAGRGRVDGRSWVCPAGKGLLFSVAIDTQHFSGPSSCLSLLVGLVLADVLGPYLARDQVFLKWPNDVIVRDSKLAGVLIQHEGPWAVVGVGVNVNLTAEELPKQVRTPATSLLVLTGREADREALLGDFIGRFLEEVARVPPWEPVLRRYLRHDYLIGREIEFDEAQVVKTAIVKEIAADGALLVFYPDGSEERLYGGEVRLRVRPTS